MTEKIKRVRKAVLPVAGLGTRFFPATKAIPKEMLPVVDKPLIQYAVEESFLKERGKPDLAREIREISGELSFSYTRQSEALGLGHAVLCAAELVGEEPFAVLLGDVIMDGPIPATRVLIDQK